MDELHGSFLITGVFQAGNAGSLVITGSGNLGFGRRIRWASPSNAFYTISNNEIARLERHLLVLATIGSAGPFVGLFGTVWGIMTSFRAIAGQQSTSLAVVAPGIAEALFATAVGLIAAIPATIFYNKFVSDVNKQAQRLQGFADEFAAILSRQIDERG